VMLHENPPHPWMDHQGSTNYDTPNLKQNFKQWAGANIENPPHPGPSTTKSPTWWSMQPWCGYDEMARHLYGGMDHQGLTTYNTPDDDLEELNDSQSFKKQWSRTKNYEAFSLSLPILTTSRSRRVYFEEELVRKVALKFIPEQLQTCQGTPRGLPVTNGARDDLETGIGGTNSRPGHISKNFTNTFPASDLIPPIMTQKSLSKTKKSLETPERARPPEHEQQEVDESRSSSFDKRWAGANIENPPYPGPLMAPEKWAASFCQKELNDGQGISNSDSRSRARDPNELNDSQSFKKQWPRMNLQIPPHSWPSQFSMGIQNYEAFGLSPPIWTPKGLGKTTSSDAPMRARPPEQFAGTSLHIPCIWTLTISDPWWYLYGLYQGEPPPKNRRLFRPNGKRTRIKEDLQGQLSLHGGNVGPPVSVERFCEEISMKLRSSSIFSSIFMITELSKLGPNQS
jgi:hypothetical protein